MECYRIKEDEGRMLVRRAETYADLETAVQSEFAGSFAWILFWEQYRVDFAWYDGEQIHWPEEKKAEATYLLEARIFNQEKEAVLRKSAQETGFRARVLEECAAEERKAGDFSNKENRWGEAGETKAGSADSYAPERIGEEQKMQNIRETEQNRSGQCMNVVYRFTEEPAMWGSQMEGGTISEERGMRYHLPFTVPSEQVSFGYRMKVYRKPDPEDGMLRLLDYRMTGIYQKIGQKKQFLEEGR